MADDDNHEVGRKIVRAMRSVVQSANGAVIVDFDKRAKQFSLAAARATTTKAAFHCCPEVALFERGGLAGQQFGGWV